MNNKKDKTEQYKRDMSNMYWQDQSYHWEEVPDEDLWEDGELKLGEVFDKINYHLFVKGDWKLIKETDFPDDEDDGRNKEWEEIND